jgi:hypothetical protein
VPPRTPRRRCGAFSPPCVRKHGNMTDRIFADEVVARFGGHYPGEPVKLAHKLLGHPLLELDSIAALAQRMRPRDVEYNAADLPISVPQEDLP